MNVILEYIKNVCTAEVSFLNANNNYWLHFITLLTLIDKIFMNVEHILFLNICLSINYLDVILKESYSFE